MDSLIRIMNMCEYFWNILTNEAKGFGICRATGSVFGAYHKAIRLKTPLGEKDRLT